MSIRSVTRDDNVGIAGFLAVEQYISSGSTRLVTTVSQVGTTVVGSGDFVSGMVGGILSYSDVSYFIIGYTSAFSITVSTSSTRTNEEVAIVYGGTQIGNEGIAAPAIVTTDFVAADITCTTADVLGVATTNSLIVTTTADVGGDYTTTNGDITTTNGTVTGNVLASPTGNITTLNSTTVNNTGNYLSTNGNITTTNGTISGNTVNSTNIVTTNLQTATLSLPSLLTTKGEILAYNGTNTVGFGPGTDGFPLVYDSTQSSGLGSSLSGMSGGTLAGGLYTGASMVVSARGIGQIAIFNVRQTGTFTNTSGGNATFELTVSSGTSPNYARFLPALDTVYAVQAIVGGVAGTYSAGLRSTLGNILISLGAAASTTPWTDTWPAGTTIVFTSVNLHCLVTG